MPFAVVLILLVVGSVLFHLLSPWTFTELASDWGMVDFVVDITFPGHALGIQEPRLIFDFVLASWSGLGSAFGPVVIGILYYKRMTWEGVLSGMLGGFLASVAWLIWFKADYHGLYEAIPGFIAGMVLTYVVSWLTCKKE